MTLYEINQQILNAIEYGCDPETGEIISAAALNALEMAKEEKTENIVLLIKEINAENKAIKDEEQALAARRVTGERRVEWLKDYLKRSLDGEKFKTPRCSVSYRKTQAVQIVDEGALPEDFVTVYTSPRKMAIKEALKAGHAVPGAILEDRMSMIIK